MKYLPQWNCLVRIKYGGDTNTEILQCYEDANGKFIIVPLGVDDYPTLFLNIKQDNLRVRPTTTSFVQSSCPDCELECVELVDLDEIEELPLEDE